MPSHFSIPEILHLLERANNIASTSQLEALLERMLDLMLEVCAADSGTLYLLDGDELEFRLVRGKSRERLQGQRIPKETGIVGATLREGHAIEVTDIVKDPRWAGGPAGTDSHKLRKVISFPLLLRGEPVGVVQLFNYAWPELAIVQLLGNRMASELEQAQLLEASRAYGQRLEALVSIIREISSSLDRSNILQMIIEYACLLLRADVGSLFMLDEDTGELVIQQASKDQQTLLYGLRVPPGRGIIGHVVRNGKTVIVADASQDPRHYPVIDEITGYTTRSLMAVPLRTQRINLGAERGDFEQRIIGGLEVLNKKTGVFTQQDARLFETLANQAATVLQIVALYQNTEELFLDVIRVISAAIDAKDPYTEGHSQRVSDFAVAVAREMNLPAETLHHIRIAGLLHDVGKIGIPDNILNKPGSLTGEEYGEMKKHPAIGAHIMGGVRMLQTELEGISQHHERLSGAGYPLGLKNVSLVGRIIAVADIFDAATSDRPYHQAADVQDAFAQLIDQAGIHLDEACVYALMRAYAKNDIHTQKETQ
jgi:HD-GYP domain-containing protein (c-di-GMP phosphodiesterase class II)